MGIRTLLYADDTLVVEADTEFAQLYMDSIRRQGASLGLSLNNNKVEVLTINSCGDLFKPGGDKLSANSSLIYLGSVLTRDGRIQSELGRRIGLATEAFKELEKVCVPITVN